MMDRGIPLELWAHYVKQLETAQQIAMEDSVLLLFSLKNFIHTLKAPKSFPKGRTGCESLECDTVENWSIDFTVFFVLNEKFPAVYSRKLMCHFPFSSHPRRWYVVESWAAARRQQGLPASAHWALWDGSQWCWCHSFSGSDETFHKGTRSSFSDILFHWRWYYRLFQFWQFFKKKKAGL